nr:sn1-specific diacylglycerol lipase alpha [Ciona intestinalis]|eukprot:XP_018673317.2 sn1-specific diacylglycerol lipase alpha [Ciona intestinalis]
MPGIVLFKRRWLTGSDDLVLPCFILALLHFTLLIVIIVYVTTSPDIVQYSNVDLNYLVGRNANASFITKVSCAQKVRRISFGYVGLLAGATLLELTIARFSMLGTILNAEKREPISYFLYFRFVVGISELAYTIGAAVHLSGNWDKCHSILSSYNIPIGM